MKKKNLRKKGKDTKLQQHGMVLPALNMVFEYPERQTTRDQLYHHERSYPSYEEYASQIEDLWNSVGSHKSHTKTFRREHVLDPRPECELSNSARERHKRKKQRERSNYSTRAQTAPSTSPL